MNFIMYVAAIMIALILTNAIGIFVITRKSVLRWYTKLMMKNTEQVMNTYVDNL